MDALKQGSDALLILLGGIMVLAMHAGFAFLELGTELVRSSGILSRHTASLVGQ